MKVGNYKKRSNLAEFEVKKFPFTIWDKNIYVHANCGEHLLATLVGKENPYQIRLKNKNTPSCEDAFVKRYLKQNGFKLLEVTQCLLSNRKSTILNGMIKDYHVLITSNLVRKNECSWFAVYFSNLIHNQEIIPLSKLDFLNFPVHTAYLITHKKFK